MSWGSPHFDDSLKGEESKWSGWSGEMASAISERMDGEHLRPGLVREVEFHVDGCLACTDFSRRAAHVRTLVRIAPAEQRGKARCRSQTSQGCQPLRG